jgi:hypothetical protein
LFTKAIRWFKNIWDVFCKTDVLNANGEGIPYDDEDIIDSCHMPGLA